MSELVPALKETLFAPTYDLAAEYAEIGLDLLLENDTLKAIPVVSTIAALCKTGYNLHERNLIKQTLSFISAFNGGNVDPEKIEKYRQVLESDPKKVEKELGRVIIILGNHIEELQSKVLGAFYLAYVKGSVSWGKFCELSEANRRMFISDYAILAEAARDNGLNIEERELYQVDRLISLGLLQNRNRLGGVQWGNFTDPPTQDKDILITSLGKTFYQHMPRLDS